MREHVAETEGAESSLTPSVVQHAGAERYGAPARGQAYGYGASAGELRKTLQNSNLSSSSHLTRSLLQMQRTYGNRYVQRALALARQGEGEVTSTADSGLLAPSRGYNLGGSGRGVLRVHPPISVVQQKSAVVYRQDAPDPEDPFKDPTKRPDPLTCPEAPLDKRDKSLTCGIENGKFTCHPDIGKGDPLNVP